MTGVVIGGVLLMLLLGGLLFMYVSPQFGMPPTDKQKATYKSFDYFKDGRFTNMMPTTMDLGFKSMIELSGEYWNSRKVQKSPGQELPLVKADSVQLANLPRNETTLMWFGHSAFLLNIEGKKILIDPMLGDSPSPVSFIGTKRFSPELPISAEKLPPIDAVVFSHDHYDHLDYGTIQKLKDKTGKFYVPLGLEVHLSSWGVPEEKIVPMHWWEERELDGIKFVCTPARHFSGRGLTDRNATLWSSWVISGQNENIYFSGDGGYGPHFKEVGTKYGPFDFAMVECGQYNEKWKDIHMMPEETVQAAMDVRAKRFMPIHWGAFTLALHSWTDPIERAVKKAEESGIPISTPVIGERILISSGDFPDSKWWKF